MNLYNLWTKTLAGMLSVSMLCGPVLASGNVSRERLEKSRARQNADLLIVTGKLDGAEIGGLAALAAGAGAGIGAGVTYAVLHRKLVAQDTKFQARTNEFEARTSEFDARTSEFQVRTNEFQARLEKLKAKGVQLRRENNKLRASNARLQTDLTREVAVKEALAEENKILVDARTRAHKINEILKIEHEYAAKGGQWHLGDLYNSEQIRFLNWLVMEETEIPSVIKYQGRTFAIREGFDETFFRSIFVAYHRSRWALQKQTVITPKYGEVFALVYKKAKSMPERVESWLAVTYSSDGPELAALRACVQEVPSSTVAKASLRLVGQKVSRKALPAVLAVGLLGGAVAWGNSQVQEQEILARVEENPSLWMNLSDEDFERVAQSDKLAESYLAFNDALHELAQIPAAELQQALQEGEEYEKQQQTVQAQQLRRELTGRLAF